MTLVYEPPGSACSGKAQLGVKNLRMVVMRQFAGIKDAGIYNCRTVNVPGYSSKPSAHGEGRAWDAGMPYESAVVGHRLAAWLVANADYLGVQLVIWDRHKWGGSSWTWRPYGGYPHTDHVHVELNWVAARELTVAKIERLFVEGAAETDQKDDDMPFLYKRKDDPTGSIYVSDGVFTQHVESPAVLGVYKTFCKDIGDQFDDFHNSLRNADDLFTTVAAIKKAVS